MAGPELYLKQEVTAGICSIGSFMMRRERAAGINSGSRYTVLFFSAYFIYYAAYCIFSSYTVLFLTERAYSATVCGIITSLTLLAKLLMATVGA